MREIERLLWARCAEPNTQEIFNGILRWKNDIGLPDIDPESQLVQILGQHHTSFAGHKHGNFALFMTEALAKVLPVESKDIANLKLLFPLSVGQITVARIHDVEMRFIGFKAYGPIEPYVK